MDYIESLSRDPAERDAGFFLHRLEGTTVPPPAVKLSSASNGIRTALSKQPTSEPASYSGLPHRHDFQEIIILRSGQGRHTIDGHPVDFCPRTVCFIAKGHVHLIQEAAGVKGWLIRFSDAFLPPDLVSHTWNYHLTLLNQLGPNRNLILQASKMRELERVLKFIESEYAGPATFQKQSALRHLLSLLIIQIARVYREALGTNGQDQEGFHLGHGFTDLLEHYFTQYHDVQYYARALHVPPSKLSKTLGRILGKPTKQIIEERIILEAKRYLHYSERSVKEIAFVLGYGNAFHLSKTFKRLVGVGPQAFRNKRQD